MSAAPSAGGLRPIEIIGGGLAGLSLGIALRRAHVPVTVHEAGSYPRHRVCGEFIAGLAPKTIARLGLAPLLEDALRHDEVAWFLPRSRPRMQRLPAPALGISRQRLDARLAGAFIAVGGDLRTGSRVSVEETARNTPASRAPSGRVYACGRRAAPRSRWIGLKVHASSLELTRELELHPGADCYVGLARIEEGAVNICGLFRRRPLRERGPELLLAYLRAAGLAALAGRLEAATLDPTSFCAIAALDYSSRRGRAPDELRIGDASALIPPFTGNGMAMAFQSAELALDPLLAYARGAIEWAEACRATDAALRGRFRVRLASAEALHPFLLRARGQRCLAALNRLRLIPFGPLYATLH